MISKQFKYLGLALALLLVAAPASAQKGARRAADPLKAEYTERREKLETAVKEYKESLESLIELLERDEAATLADAERLRGLLDEGIVARREIEQSELKHATAKAKVAEARKQLEEADVLLHEAKAADQFAVLPPSRTRAYVATAAVIRYTGGRWALQDIGKVQSFFATRFGRSLPISAFGQSAVHDRLGFDHRNAVDVPVHPDSAEGQAIVAYLRSAGIPFLAFRSAVPGQSTGAHIHIGWPSSRLQ